MLGIHNNIFLLLRRCWKRILYFVTFMNSFYLTETADCYFVISDDVLICESRILNSSDQKNEYKILKYWLYNYWFVTSWRFGLVQLNLYVSWNIVMIHFRNLHIRPWRIHLRRDIRSLFFEHLYYWEISILAVDVKRSQPIQTPILRTVFVYESLNEILYHITSVDFK